MARIRTVKPDFWTSPSVGRLSRDARLLFVGLLTESDDEGRLLGSAKRLVGCLYAHDEDVTPRKFERWLTELETEGMVRVYHSGGVRYFLLPGFTTHQRISHPTPSRLPEPGPNGSGIPPENLLGEGKGKEGNREGETPSADPSGRRKPKRPIPSPFVLSDEQVEWVRREIPGLDYDNATEEWVLAAHAKDFRYSDWDAAWKNAMRRANRWHKPEAARTHL